MRSPLLLLILLLSSVYAEGGCPIYKCGDFPQNEDSQFCVKNMDGNGDIWHTQRCPEEAPFCQTQKMEDEEPSLDNPICGVDPTVDLLTHFCEGCGHNTDGGYCTQDADCYTAREGKAECIDNVCTSLKKAGDSCIWEYGLDCPRGTFCHDENMTCTPILKPGENCKKDWQCGVEHSCVKILAKSDDPVCIPNNSLEDGEIINPYFNHAEILNKSTNVISSVMMSEFCKSHFQVVYSDNRVQCRPADRNINPSLATQNPGEDCIIEQYREDDPLKYNVSSTRVEKSRCGYNKDSRAYCPLQIGDDYAKDLAESFKGIFTKYNCGNTDIIPHFGVACSGLYQSILRNEDDYFNYDRYHKLFYELSDSEWINTANNDDCVKDTITYSSWMGFGKDHTPHGLLKSSF